MSCPLRSPGVEVGINQLREHSRSKGMEQQGVKVITAENQKHKVFMEGNVLLHVKVENHTLKSFKGDDTGQGQKI